MQRVVRNNHGFGHLLAAVSRRMTGENGCMEPWLFSSSPRQAAPMAALLAAGYGFDVVYCSMHHHVPLCAHARGRCDRPSALSPTSSLPISHIPLHARARGCRADICHRDVVHLLASNCWFTMLPHSALSPRRPTRSTPTFTKQVADAHTVLRLPTILMNGDGAYATVLRGNETV